MRTKPARTQARMNLRTRCGTLSEQIREHVFWQDLTIRSSFFVNNPG